MATIQGIYVALFGRPADPAGLAFFNEATNNGADLTAIGDLASTAEYQSRFEGMTNEQIVNSIYQSLFERDGEAAGVDFYVGELEAGRLNINNIAIAILDGAQNDDLATVNAKIAAANLFTTHLDLQVEIDAYAGDSAAAIGRTYIDAVTGTDAATEAEADAAILLLLGQGGQDPDGGNGGGGDATTFTLAELLALAPADVPGQYNLPEGGIKEALGTIDVAALDRIPDLIANADNGATFAGYTADLTDSFTNILTTSDAEVSEIGSVVANNDDGLMTANFSQFTTTNLEINILDGGTDNVDGVQGGLADDVINGGIGNDYLRGLDGNDEVYGGDGNDSVHGNIGNDFVDGGAGNDIVQGGKGNDTVNGGAGNDTVKGDLDDDIIVGSTGTDTLEGGAGLDTFEFANGTSLRAAFSTITDFVAADDSIDLGGIEDYSEQNGFGFNAFGVADVAADVFFNGGKDVYVVFNANATGDAWVFVDSDGSGNFDVASDTFITLKGINNASLISESDFI